MLNLKSVIQPMDVLHNGHWNHASVNTNLGTHTISIAYDSSYPTGVRSGAMVYTYAVGVQYGGAKKVIYHATAIAMDDSAEETISSYRNTHGGLYRKFCCHYLDWYGAKVYHNGTQIN